MAKISIMTGGMHCPSCEKLIKDCLDGADGVIKADASCKRGIILVKFDEKKINESKIKKIIKEEGYEVK